MNKRNSRLRMITLLAAAVLALAALCACSAAPAPAADGAEKTVTVTVYADPENAENFEEITCTGTQETLDAVLVDNGLVEDCRNEYGLLIETVNGRTADMSKEEWWCITKGGEMVMEGASSIKVADGDKYELTLKVGYDF